MIKESVMSWSGDDYAVKDENGVPVVMVTGRAFSMTDRKHITDCQGQELFQLENKLFSWRSTVMGMDRQGNVLFEVKKRNFTWGVTLEAFFHDPHTGQDLTLILDGDWMGYGGNITVGEGGPVIAQMQREFRGRDFFGGQTYAVSVAPGVDLALMAALCICFDCAMDRRRR